MAAEVTTEERFVASMVLSGVGDAIGFRNGRWEFCHSGRVIHNECEELGGVENLHVQCKHYIWLPLQLLCNNFQNK